MQVAQSNSRATAASAGRFMHLDAVRALAIMLVIVAHAGLGGTVPGGTGVTIFFSLSGFIITYLLLRERDRTGTFHIGSFYLRRALKIGPPFIVAIGGATAIYALGHPVSARDVGEQFFFLWNWVQALPHHHQHVVGGSIVIWSLAIEEQFYIVFALLWLAVARTPRAGAVVLVVSLAAVVICNVERVLLAAAGGQTWRIYFGTDTRMDAIALGVLSALFYHWWTSVRPYAGRPPALLSSDWMVPIVVGAVVASLVYRQPWFRDTFRYLIQSLAACGFILYGFFARDTAVHLALRRVLSLRAVQLVGLASYSIYIVHDVLFALLRPRMAGVAAAPHALLLTIVALVAGLALYYAVEVPCARIRSRLHRQAESTPAAPLSVDTCAA